MYHSAAAIARVWGAARNSAISSRTYARRLSRSLLVILVLAL
jgi:hypothetical protein